MRTQVVVVAALALVLLGLAWSGALFRGASSFSSSTSSSSSSSSRGRPRRFTKLDDALTGAHMSALGNATIRAEVGHATWTLLHTMAARFPDEPTPEQTDDFREWILLLARLYPCGQCAEEFQVILRAHPPEVRWRERENERASERMGNIGDIRSSERAGARLDSMTG